MNTLVKVGVGVAVVAIAVGVVPALKGPYNRIKNTANDKLNQEFVVDNYKAEYIKLNDSRSEIVATLNKIKVEQAVANKKLNYALDKVEAAKKNLVATGSENLTEFNRAKDAYELAKVEVSNFRTMIESYSNAVAKLEDSLSLVNSNMSKAKMNVATLETKKDLVDAIKKVNKTVENVSGVNGDDQLDVNVEKLNDDILRESIKLEALRESKAPSMTKNQAKEYLNALN